MNDSPDAVSIIPATAEDLPRISTLAGVIWRESYPGMISGSQIEYMLALMYDPSVMRAEIDQGIRYDLLVDGSVEAGFAAYGPVAHREIKLHKLYLRKDRRRGGLGSLMLRHVMAEARAAGFETIVLNVNKGNAQAIAAYERNGFEIRESVVVDIGGGFVMDDYIMTRPL